MRAKGLGLERDAAAALRARHHLVQASLLERRAHQVDRVATLRRALRQAGIVRGNSLGRAALAPALELLV